VSSPEIKESEQGSGLAVEESPDVRTTTIAARMKSQSASDLVMAAAAYLQLIQGKTSFSTQELLANMKTATECYKTTMSNNLTATITTLCTNGTLNKVSGGGYALSSAKKTEMEKISC
jgi:hypothetical protein